MDNNKKRIIFIRNPRTYKKDVIDKKTDEVSTREKDAVEKNVLQEEKTDDDKVVMRRIKKALPYAVGFLALIGGFLYVYKNHSSVTDDYDNMSDNFYGDKKDEYIKTEEKVKNMENRRHSRQAEFGDSIDLAHGRYKEFEFDKLKNLRDNFDEYSSKKATTTNSFTDFCSEGKYSGHEETTYSFEKNEDGKICITEDYSYHDDDGDSRSWQIKHTNAREILNIMREYF
ncbi:MAG: hypothetical protein K6A29_04200 [Lachnospiraceae bacterium]|nr:hypothetical protein [Lachnospiraceae bacterium]